MAETKTTTPTARALAEEAVRLLIERRGVDIRMYRVEGTSSVTDYYINVSGRSGTHVAALSDELTERLETVFGARAARVEGRRGESWILVDYVDVVVNIFDKPSREFYNFDRLLPAESEQDISALVAEVDRKMGGAAQTPTAP